MSDNPYAPPGSDLGGDPAGGALEASGDFDIGQCLSEAWANTWSNFPLWLVVGLVGVTLGVVATVTVIGAILVVPVLTWGATLFSLHMHDGSADFGDLFAGFSNYATALVGMLVCVILIFLVGVAGQSVQIAGEVTDNDFLALIGLPINLAVAFLVTSRLSFAYLYVVDQGMPPIQALRQAWEDTRPVMWKIVALVLLHVAIMLAGVALLVVGVIPALVVATLMWVSAYRQLVGRAA